MVREETRAVSPHFSHFLIERFETTFFILRCSVETAELNKYIILLSTDEIHRLPTGEKEVEKKKNHHDCEPIQIHL
jgi:hypothetical protein